MDERALRDLEERLPHPEVRASADALTPLLAEDFVGFGSSGIRWQVLFHQDTPADRMGHGPGAFANG